MSEREIRLIDQIWGELNEKNILNEVVFINITKSALEELMADYTDEFKNELSYSGRRVSSKDIEDYFKVSLLVSPLKDGQKYQLLTKV
jgi:hypothetical protein